MRSTTRTADATAPVVALIDVIVVTDPGSRLISAQVSTTTATHELISTVQLSEKNLSTSGWNTVLDDGYRDQAALLAAGSAVHDLGYTLSSDDYVLDIDDLTCTGGGEMMSIFAAVQPL